MRNKEGLNWEVSVGVTFASFMSAVALFFTGALIAQFSSFEPGIKVPLLFLIISTFSFIFSASIYSNAGIEITAGKESIVKKYLIYANNILEFLGLYLFILATPMVIGAITTDSFLHSATIAIALVGVVLYSQSAFSVLHKEVKNFSHKALFTLTIAATSLILYIAQALELAAYKPVATFLLIFLFSSTTFFCRRSKQYSNEEF